MKLINLNEEIKRVKSLFGDSRLYGNLVTESSGGRYGWLDDLIRMVDNTHPKGVLTNKKWAKFSQRVKNADGFLGEVRKSVDFQKFLTVDLQDEIISVIANVVTNNSKKAKLTDNFLSDGIWKNIKKTFTDNGIDLSKSVSFKNQTQSVEKHLDDIWQMSTHKTSLNQLQNNIENLLSDKKTYSLGDVELDEVVTKIRKNFEEELDLLKTSDDAPDLLDDVSNVVRRSADNADIKSADELATNIKLARDAIMKKGILQGQEILRNKKLAAAEWAAKYAEKLNNIFGILLKTPFTSNSALPKFMGYIRAFNGNSSDQIFSLYFKDGLLPIRPFVDLLGLYPARLFHWVGRRLGIKSAFNEMSTMYKISVLSGSIALQENIAWGVIDVVKYTIQKMSEMNYLPNYFSSANLKNRRLIWKIGLAECYEKKYNDGINDVNTNSEAYDDGEGLFYDDDDFDKIEIETIDNKSKSDYKNWVKNIRKEKKNDSWLPENFCSYFVCKNNVTPIKVQCARYGGVGDENSKQDAIDAAESVMDVYEKAKNWDMELDKFPGNTGDSTNLQKKIEALNKDVKLDIDKLIESNDMEGIKNIFEQIGIDVDNSKEFTKDVNEKVSEQTFM